jgi:hypothetical protein
MASDSASFRAKRNSYLERSLVTARTVLKPASLVSLAQPLTASAPTNNRTEPGHCGPVVAIPKEDFRGAAGEDWTTTAAR